MSPALQADSLPTEPPGKSVCTGGPQNMRPKGSQEIEDDLTSWIEMGNGPGVSKRKAIHRMIRRADVCPAT